jgi:hypothetical protein
MPLLRGEKSGEKCNSHGTDKTVETLAEEWNQSVNEPLYMLRYDAR